MSSILSQSGEVGPDDSVSQIRDNLYGIDDEDIYGDELTSSVSALPTKTNSKSSTIISSRKVRIPPVSELTIVNQDNVAEVAHSLIVYFFYDDILIFRNPTQNFNGDSNLSTDH
jgi:hypothetical protein